MWTATIKSKEFSSGQFKALVEFSNGTHTVEEKIALIDSDNLNRVIRAKIKQFTDAETFSDFVQVGVFTPVQESAPALSAYQLAEREVFRVKGLVELGVLTTADQEYIDAVTALKTEYINK